MKEIALTQGKVAIVDDEDFHHLSQYKWNYDCNGYAVRAITTGKGKQTKLLMHRVIMNTPLGMQTDHKDHNKLNNQKHNLRICTQSQNLGNQRKSWGKASRFKGVSINKYNRYVTQISVNGKRFAKTFPLTPEGEKQAALHYNELAVKYHGEFAFTNTID